VASREPGSLDRFQERLRRRLDATAGAAWRRRRNAGRGYRPIFVAAAMGSGTSVLAVDLAQRFDVAGLVYESAFQVPARSFLRAQPVAAFASVSEYERAIEPGAGWSPDAGRDALLHCYRSWCTGASDWVVDKGPNTNLVRAGFLARCFPDAPFLLLFRDPVANVEGFVRKWPVFGRDGLARSIAFYGSIHEAFLRFAEAEPKRVLAVEYEDFVENHDATLERVARWVGLEPARERRWLGRVPNVEGLGVRNLQGDQVVIVRDANASAYRRLAAEQVDAIRARLGPLHARMQDLAARR
jgi:hypothetical protein